MPSNCESQGYSILKMIVTKWGTHCGIAPRTDGSFEIWNKKNESLGFVYFHKPWKSLVWEQNTGIIMSKKCLDDAFRLVEEAQNAKQ